MKFESMELVADDLKVSWEYAGEGCCGDYSGDADDEPLLRFYCSEKRGGQWVDFDDASYCTRLPVNTERPVLQRGLEVILSALQDCRNSGLKRRMEELSWLCVSDLQRK